MHPCEIFSLNGLSAEVKMNTLLFDLLSDKRVATISQTTQMIHQ
jgi:hypothetical protein